MISHIKHLLKLSAIIENPESELNVLSHIHSFVQPMKLFTILDCVAIVYLRGFRAKHRSVKISNYWESMEKMICRMIL